jgi:hypothetical protein
MFLLGGGPVSRSSFRILLPIAATLVLALGTAVPARVSSAGAALPTITANGTVNCAAVGGKVSFTPPIETFGDSNSDTAAIAASLKACTFTSTNLPAGSILSGKVKASIITTTVDNSANACAGLGTSRATVLTIKWVDKNSAGTNLAHVVASTVSFSGFDILVNGLIEPGFDLPQDSGGTASATGSFTGTDSGASSESNVFAKKTTNQVTASCNSESKYGTTDGLVTLPVGGVGTASDPSHALVG